MDHVARGCVIKGFNCLIWVVYELARQGVFGCFRGFAPDAARLPQSFSGKMKLARLLGRNRGVARAGRLA
jgi:hypothetical protein